MGDGDPKEQSAEKSPGDQIVEVQGEKIGTTEDATKKGSGTIPQSVKASRTLYDELLKDFKLIEKTPEQKEAEHFENMYRVWENVKENADSDILRFPEIRAALSDDANIKFFSVLIESHKKRGNDLRNFVDSVRDQSSENSAEKSEKLYRGKNQDRAKLCGAQLLSETQFEQIEKLAENADKPKGVFGGLDTSARTYEQYFSEMTKEEHSFLAGLLYLDIEASFMDENPDERKSLSVLERFQKARKNYDMIHDVVDELNDNDKRKFEYYYSDKVKDLREKNEINPSEIDQLKEWINDIVNPAQFANDYKLTIQRDLGPKSDLFLERYNVLKRFYKEKNLEKVEEILRAEVGFTSAQVAMAKKYLAPKEGDEEGSRV